MSSLSFQFRASGASVLFGSMIARFSFKAVFSGVIDRFLAAAT
jgi:hypothetical protein